MKTTDVRFWEARRRNTKVASWEVRWIVAGQHRSTSRRTKALAEAFLAELRAAARRGELFDTGNGLPDSMQPADAGLTWLEFAQQYVDMKWPRAAAKTRDSMTDALATITAALVPPDESDPDQLAVREVLRQYLLPPAARGITRPPEIDAVAEWLTARSLPLKSLGQPRYLRVALDAIALTLAGGPAAATTVHRKRAVLNNALQYGVELELLPANNLGKIGWRAPQLSEVVDRRVVVNPTQARELLTAVTYVGPVDRGRHLTNFFACPYYAGLRPAEAQGLRVQDCELPKIGWGYLNLAKSRPESNRRWTDTGDAHEERGLKHRATASIRRVPIPPVLVTILREHLAEFGAAPDGRVFNTRPGGGVGSNYADFWSQARNYALTPTQVLSPLAARPYDLRHAAVSLWLNSGVPAPDVAERAGHGVDVLLRVYASCIDGTETISNSRIDDLLAGP
jgi:integrase